MAANDEYVHTEGLNVKKRPHPTERQRKTQSQESKQKNESDKRQNNYLLDSVAELMAEKSSRQAIEQEKLQQAQETRKQFMDKEANRKKQQRHSLHTMNHDDDDDDDDSVFSNEGDDPILNMMNGKDATINTNTNTFSSMQIGTPSKSTSKTKKDPNRFMADLDARISKTPTRNKVSIPNTTDASNPLAQVSTAFQSFSSSPDKMNWLKQVAPKNIQDTMLPFKIPGLGPDHLNEKECEPLHRRNPEDDDENDEEKVIVTNSTNIMGDQESAELMRIRSRMNQDVFSVGMDLLEKNRYYVWVVVTFFVMILGYLLTKNKTDDGIR